MTRVFDTVMFGGELDMLECRLRHLDGLVDRFVISEAQVTHAGYRRELVFSGAKERFGPWLDRITYIPMTADELPGGMDEPGQSHLPDLDRCPKAWARENAQRDALARGLADAETGALVLVGDLDELPDLPVLAALKAKPPAQPVALAMRTAQFAVDWVNPRLGLNTIVGQVQHLGPLGTGFITRKHAAPVISASGWHFSWLGGPEAIAVKAALMSPHQEIRDKILEANADGRLYEQGWCPWDTTRLLPVDNSATWPEWVKSRECPPVWFRPR